MTHGLEVIKAMNDAAVKKQVVNRVVIVRDQRSGTEAIYVNREYRASGCAMSSRMIARCAGNELMTLKFTTADLGFHGSDDWPDSLPELPESDE